MKALTLPKRFCAASLMLAFSSLLVIAGTTVAANEEVKIRVFTPRANDLTGAESTGFVVSLRFKFPGDLASTGVTLPGLKPEPEPEPETTADESSVIAADSAAEGSGSGANPNFPGLVVLLSNNKDGAGQNLAKRFSLLGVSHRKYEDEVATPQDEGKLTNATHIWTSWVVDAKGRFGTVGEIEPAILLVAIVEGDAPDVVEDLNEDGKLTRKDLKLMEYKILSKVERVPFDVNGF